MTPTPHNQPVAAAPTAPRSARGASKWIEAVRLRTLPAGCAGVFVGTAYAVEASAFRAAPALLCLVFALLAQIASNFANEYFDWRSGTDRPGRDGFRRGVAEGDISPRAMLTAALLTLALACCAGLALIWWGGWWLLAAGAAIALAVFAYSAGPLPLSRVGLGEAAVLLFYGVAAVNLTYWLQAQQWSWTVLAGSVGTGLLAANIMVVNNTRDVRSDRAAGRRTLAVRLGVRFMTGLYCTEGILGLALLVPLFPGPLSWLLILFDIFVVALGLQLSRRSGRALNAVLSRTGLLLFAISIASLLTAILTR